MFSKVKDGTLQCNSICTYSFSTYFLLALSSAYNLLLCEDIGKIINIFCDIQKT